MEGFGAEEILGLRRCGGCHGIFPSSSSFFLTWLVLVGWIGGEGRGGCLGLFWGN